MKNIKVKFSIFIFVFQIQFLIAATPTDSLKIAFADVHTSDVTHMVVHPSGDYFFTGDEAGKILMWRTNDYTYYKTITDGGTSRAVRGMGFRENGQVLVVAQGLQGSFLSTERTMLYGENQILDSVAFYYPFEKRDPVKSQLSFDILSHGINETFLFGLYVQGTPFLMAYDDKPAEKAFFQIAAEEIITAAAISPKKDFIAFTERKISADYRQVSVLKVVDVKKNEIIFNHLFDNKIVQMLFDENEPELFLFVYNSESKSLEVLDLPLSDFNLRKQAEFPTHNYSPPKVDINSSNGYIIVVKNPDSWPIILKKEGSNFININIPWDEIAHYRSIPAAALVPGKNHMVCWTTINSYFGLSPEMFVIDYESNTNIRKYDLKTRNRLHGYFLPENSWAVTGTEQYQDNLFGGSVNEFIKYYQWGTLSNRFGRLTFRDYMQVHHNVDLGDYADFFVDEHSGKVVFPARRSSDMSFRYKYMIYDLLNDRVDSSFKTGVDLPMPIGYSDSLGRVLTTHRADRSKYQVVTKNKVYDFKGDYANVVLSDGGDNVLFISKNNQISIYQVTRNKLRYQKEIKGNDFRIGKIDAENFWISYSYISTDNLIVNESVLLSLQGNEYVENTIQKFQIVDLAYSNGIAAMVTKDWSIYIVIVGEKYKVFSGSLYPIRISLDQSAKRMMLSMSDGTVRIYDAENLEVLGVMMHPDSKSHLIIDSKGYFSSNTPTNDYLLAESNGIPISLDWIDANQNRPGEILKIFGEPDSEYLNLLAKTTRIRRSKVEEETGQSSATRSGPVIRNLTIDGKHHISVTAKKLINLDFDVVNGSDFEILLNNVKISTDNAKRAGGSEETVSFSLSIPVVDGENHIAVTAIGDNGLKSDPVENFILCKDEDQKPDLYILTIGVSDYQQSKYNLTYADKDAIDLAILYGDSSVVDMNGYMNKFFGRRYIVDSKDNKSETSEIRLYEGSYSSSHDLFQVDYNGRFWLEKGYDEKYFIWDFESAERTQVKLPNVPYIIIFYDVIIPLPDNTGFCYKGEGDKWYKFSFESHRASTFMIPTESKLFPLSNGNWVTSTVIESSYDKGTTVEVSLINGNGEKQDTESFTILLPESFSNPELVGVSLDRTRFVFVDYKSVCLVSKSGNDIKVQEIKGFVHNYGSIYQFTDSNESLTSLNTHFDDRTGFSGFKNYRYNLSSAKLDSSFIDNSDFAYIGLNNLGGKLRWISTREPIAEIPGYFGNAIKERSEIKPVSFRKVHARVLTNEDATRQNVIESIEKFLSPARTNDQVMVFISGHGVLDQSFNYYFAPHDMDFTNPEANGISYDTILAQLQKSPSAKKLLIMDTCHSGDLFDIESVSHSDGSDDDASGRKGAAMVQNESMYAERVSEIIAMLFDNISSSSGITVITASSGTDVAYESRELSNGALTTAFIGSIEKELKGSFGFSVDTYSKNPQPLTDDFIYQLQKAVISSTRGKQIPNVREINKLSGLKVW